MKAVQCYNKCARKEEMNLVHIFEKYFVEETNSWRLQIREKKTGYRCSTKIKARKYSQTLLK